MPPIAAEISKALEIHCPSVGYCNWKDHRVSFDEAVEVFRDLNGIEEIDEDHSTEEETRFYRIGFSGTRLLYVVFAVVDPNIIRIIHARVASKVIARRYEKRKE